MEFGAKSFYEGNVTSCSQFASGRDVGCFSLARFLDVLNLAISRKWPDLGVRLGRGGRLDRAGSHGGGREVFTWVSSEITPANLT